MSIKIDLSGVSKKVNNICKNDRVGLYTAETYARYMSQFVPMDTGALYQNYQVDPFKVTYTSPYAHRLYEGKNFKFNKEKHPLATSHWDVATKSAKGHQIAQDISAFISKGV